MKFSEVGLTRLINLKVAWFSMVGKSWVERARPSELYRFYYYKMKEKQSWYIKKLSDSDLKGENKNKKSCRKLRGLPLFP